MFTEPFLAESFIKSYPVNARTKILLFVKEVPWNKGHELARISNCQFSRKSRRRAKRLSSWFKYSSSL
ncbi:hypothetical protein AWC38_SpisGene14738 [Stylophora pistillata]|uniref:Uncharacterized protein n=1 Tax=Stylophora pistillata TaxID=50429 RepID=A0A2B4RW59_STYPI|nr:hypothetical protein AWC38_SpisGene14738 [Stylophora pistillata]